MLAAYTDFSQCCLYTWNVKYYVAKQQKTHKNWFLSAGTVANRDALIFFFFLSSNIKSHKVAFGPIEENVQVV